MSQSTQADFPPVREMNVLGKTIRAKGYICARDGGAIRPKAEPNRLQLTIVPTQLCAAHCPFCIAAPTDDPAKLDLKKLRSLLRRLKAEDCVRGISITGGEPFTDFELLRSIIATVFEVFGRTAEVALNTNGTGIHQIGKIPELLWLDAVHISRHHWEDAVNDRIFGCRMTTAEALREALQAVRCPDLFVLNCLLLRGGVSTPEDARRYLDFALETGAGKVAFITPDPVNTWTAERTVDFGTVLRDDDPSMLFTRAYRDFDRCRCRDGVYASGSGKLIRFYGRCTGKGGPDCCRGLVIEPDGTLRDGYMGNVIAGMEEKPEDERD